MIRLSDVSLEYQSAVETVFALRNVDLRVDRGEFLAFTGPSGSGKTTLINVIAGLQRADTGHIAVGDVDVTGASDTQLAGMRLRHVGVIFQDDNLIREFTAEENVELPLRARGMSARESHEAAQSALDEVGVGELGGRSPLELSGGQRQRVGIARALVGGRAILLADEPTGALDTANSQTIFGLMRGLANRGVTVVAASHDLAIRDVADRVIEMQDGRVIEAVSAS